MLFSPEGTIVAGEPAKERRRVEIARSFAYKLNVGNYESRDFFCSQKAECYQDEADSVSSDLYQFCVEQVMQSVKEYRSLREAQQQRKAS